MGRGLAIASKSSRFNSLKVEVFSCHPSISKGLPVIAVCSSSTLLPSNNVLSVSSISKMQEGSLASGLG